MPKIPAVKGNTLVSKDRLNYFLKNFLFNIGV